ncbi:MAG: toll/interleukin-1 receptor domain-containing protein [Oscillospiraceae bacterium]|nr:toll/interleukin-1 receptor domain-containing protein [Oscillospiraceae bacterium]
MDVLNFDKDHPYAFICYKRQDKEKVVADIKVLQNDYNVNLWFDEDLTKGRHWDEEVKPILMKSKVVFFYASSAALASKNCQKELGIAKKWRINIFPIQLTNKSFIDAIKEDADKLTDKDKFDMDAAWDLISETLPTSINFPMYNSPNYYEDIMKAIKRDYREIIKSTVIEPPPEGLSSPPVEKPPSLSIKPTPPPTKKPPPSEMVKWFMEYLVENKARGIKNTEPPNINKNGIDFSTVNIENTFGFTKDPQEEQEHKIRNIAKYYIYSRPESVVIRVGVSAGTKTDDEEKKRRAKKFKDCTGYGTPTHDLVKFKEVISLKKIAPDIDPYDCGRDKLTKELLYNMLDYVMDKDDTWFGNKD